MGCPGHQFSVAPGRPISISSHSLADLGGETADGLHGSLLELWDNSLVRPRRGHSPAPTADLVGRRAQTPSRSAVTPTLTLTAHSAGRTLTVSSTTAGSSVLGGD